MGWQTFKVKDVCSVEKEKLGKDKLPYVGMEDIESGTGRFLGDLLPKSVASSTFKFSDKHVLYGRLRPYLNKVLVPNFEGHCSSEIFPLKPLHNLDRSFLAYWLRSERVVSAINRTCTGARMPRANVKELLEFDIDIPSFDEQRRIVAILDEAFADIDKARALTELNLENARELFESYLQNTLKGKGKSWLKKTLGDVCVLQRGFDLPKKNRVAGDFPLISSSGILERIDIAKVKGPGVVTGRSGSIGNVYYIDEDFWPLNTTLYVKEFYGNDEEFICWLLRHFDLTRFVSGAGVPTLNRNFVHGEFVRIPPEVNEQKKVAKRLETLQNELRGVYKIYEQKLSYLQELKKSLLQKAFTGELTKAA